MALRSPVESDLSAVGERYGLDLSALRGVLLPVRRRPAGLLAGRRGHVHENRGAPRRHRQWSRPTDAAEPLGAWYMTTKIQEATEGPLAGGTVAIKDNIMVAGVPMMNGSETVEGFVPTRDATVVTRLLAAGATITGKAVCEDLCFSGGSHTSRSGPVRNPWDLTRSAGGSSSGAPRRSWPVWSISRSAVTKAARCGFRARTGAPSATSRRTACSLHRGVPDRVDDRPPRPTPHRRRRGLVLGVLAGADGRDPWQPTDVRVDDYGRALERGVDGLRIGVVGEGFAIPDLSQPGVDDAVRGRSSSSAAPGAPRRRLGAVAPRCDACVERDRHRGATAPMVDGNAYGMNYKGLYDPELVEFYGRQWRERAARFSEPVELVVMAGDTPSTPHTVSTTRWPRTWPSSCVRRTTTRSLTTTCSSCRHCRLPRRRSPRQTPPRGVHRPGARDDRQHGPVRRHRTPGDVGARRAGRRLPPG